MHALRTEPMSTASPAAMMRPSSRRMAPGEASSPEPSAIVAAVMCIRAVFMGKKKESERISGKIPITDVQNQYVVVAYDTTGGPKVSTASSDCKTP